MHSDGSHRRLMQAKFYQNMINAKSLEAYCKVMSRAQEHLSIIYTQFIKLQVAQIRALTLRQNHNQGL